jgi:adenosine deaminase
VLSCLVAVPASLSLHAAVYAAAQELESAAVDVMTRLRVEHNVRYAELRFCPALHTLEGLSCDDAVRAVARGVRRATSDVGIDGGVLLCVLRSRSAAHGVETVELASHFRSDGASVLRALAVTRSYSRISVRCGSVPQVCLAST